MGIVEKSPEVRYLTYYLFFPSRPGVADYWVKQLEFIHDVKWELQHGNSLFKTIAKDPKKVRDLLTKGETHWKDRNKVEHRIKIEKEWQETNWGVKR